MTELVNRSAAVVQRFGGTVDKFTGDGVMAVFGAPVSLEDQAFRAYLAALSIQDEAKRLAFEVERLDGVELAMMLTRKGGPWLLTAVPPLHETSVPLILAGLVNFAKQIKGLLYGGMNPRASMPMLLSM